MVRRFIHAVVSILVVAAAMTAVSAQPAAAWCYNEAGSAWMDWEPLGSDARMNWGGGDVSYSWYYSPTYSMYYDSYVVSQDKQPKLNSNNDAKAGWTFRAAAVSYTGWARYGGTWSVNDANARKLAKDLRPCT